DNGNDRTAASIAFFISVPFKGVTFLRSTASHPPGCRQASALRGGANLLRMLASPGRGLIICCADHRPTRSERWLRVDRDQAAMGTTGVARGVYGIAVGNLKRLILLVSPVGIEPTTY